ncbi:CDGSH iron-sulfur domain-containing protein [Streptomycetaceae bacterium NBC_01309]
MPTGEPERESETARSDTARRVDVVQGGPVLMDGPVEVALPDGGVARSDRVVVAVCSCRRSRRWPWCDTSHRARRTPPTS